MDSCQLIFTVADRSYFALLKKDIHALASEVGFSSERAGRVDIIVAGMKKESAIITAFLISSNNPTNLRFVRNSASRFQNTGF